MKTFLITALLSLSTGLFAQMTVIDTVKTDSAAETEVVLPTGAPTIEWLFNEQNGVYAGLLLAIMYLSSFIPGLKRIDDKRRRALVVGVMLAMGLTIWQVFESALTWTDFLGMAVAFVGTQLTYMFALEPAKLKTPEPKRA